MRTMTITAIAVAFLAGASTIGPASADDTLYHDLGETAGIAKIVDDATANFLSDDRIKATFSETDMVRFKKMLAEQLCDVAGGPCKYSGHDMSTAHKGLHVTNFDFNSLVEDLQKGMDQAGIGFATQNRLLARLAPMQRDVVTR